ncbi:MAG: TetR/AcrR family transcriptional regulator [Alphaproteobacteria bacterium]|nr:TetR/AcrR family transcriptional regulator [Alphaproteobacteria bacterium]
MSNRKKRIYHSETRHAQAEQTKHRILDAAQKLFQSEGFENVTIEKLAQIAGVSSPTVYALFHSKCGILRAIMDEALPPDQHQALVEEIKREKSLEKRLMVAAKIARQMYDAERAQMDIFRGAFLLSQELRELEKEREQRRYKRQEESIKVTAKEQPHVKKLNLSKELDILWAFTGRDMYRLFVIERGWSSDEYESWLAQLLINTLIEIK